MQLRCKVALVLLALCASIAAAQTTNYTPSHVFVVFRAGDATNWVSPRTVSGEVAVIGGGGGSGGSGGSGIGGGGGGGGGVVTASVSLVAGNAYLAQAGFGGTNGASTLAGSNGFNSAFATNVAFGGGGGGVSSAKGNGQNGGSGGGATYNNGAGGTNVAGQGSMGGTYAGSGPPYRSAGGGGYSEAGAAGVAGTGKGGDGLNLSTWLDSLSYGVGGWFAGGGGGSGYGVAFGPGGLGGGGAGGQYGLRDPDSGLPHTGGGGGGLQYAAWLAMGNGGSGIVFLKLPRDNTNFPVAYTPQNGIAVSNVASLFMSWFPPMEGTVTNYVLRVGPQPTNMSVCTPASCPPPGTNTQMVLNLGVEAITFASVWWSVEAQMDGLSTTSPASVFYIAKGTNVFVSTNGTPVFPYWSLRVGARSVEEAYAVATEFGSITVGPGLYTNTSMLTLTNINIVGAGRTVTKFRRCIDFKGTNNSISGVGFQDIYISGSTPSATVAAQNTNHVFVYDCLFRGITNTYANNATAVYGTYNANPRRIAVSNCVAVYCTDAAVFKGLALLTHSAVIGTDSPTYAVCDSVALVSNSTVVGCSVRTAPYGAFLASPTSNVFVAYCTQSNTTANPLMKGSAYFESFGTNNIVGTSFPIDTAPYGLDSLRPLGGSVARKESLGALKFKPNPAAAVAHDVLQTGAAP